MLNVDKNKVDFLVTSSMVGEVDKFLNESNENIMEIVDEIIKNGIKKIYFVGCGSSMAVGNAGKYLFDKYSEMDTNVYTGWEFIDNTPKSVNKKAAVVLISHSGKTEEIVEALKIANKLEALTIGIVDKKEGNPLGEQAKMSIDYNAHAMWECHLLAVYLLACNYIQKTGWESEIELILNDIPKISKVLGHHIDSFEQKAIELANKAKNWKGFYTISAGPLRSLAYKEGIITNMEFMWGHGSVIESGEFRHGPLEITEEDVPFIFLVGSDASRHTTERALDFVRRYKGDCIVFDYKDFSMGLHADLAPMIMFVPLEWFSFYFALVRDHNPDDRRYYNIVKY
ncbi:SIS domain-containing protein [Alkaliphilus peptidifermentans]|uniref:Fructoselysine 6-phosphate deglycase n=1 Tax=Alkaliphilus peptidifermentans DSM 18978 TaxID=1120976 RepID=A0A1G5KS59_9FIRM|nr:SIS domain-containing protein [Alkaliphilus peptidifermentans]SCZ03194.1 fructoselysine 6-phosphate deglycase [Alkaliphilus peptidifermentans DSM 18978]